MMHAGMMDNLEEYLAGTLEPAQFREIESHLSSCRACREEVRCMREVSGLFAALRRDEADTWNVAPGFSARVMEKLEQRKAIPAFAGFFALNLGFARRLAFASLLMLAVVGGYLVTHESGSPTGPSPEAILAQQNAPGFGSNAENNMLVTLTAYEQ